MTDLKERVLSVSAQYHAHIFSIQQKALHFSEKKKSNESLVTFG